MNNNNASANVMLVGFSDRQQALFSQLFQQTDYQAFTLVSEAPVDVAIVDLDAANSEQKWRAFREQFELTPAITVSLRPQAEKGPYWLAKPINTHALKSLLVSLNPHSSAQIEQPITNAVSATAGKVADAINSGKNPLLSGRCPTGDTSSRKQGNSEPYQVEDYLEGKFKLAVQHAQQRNTAFKLTGHLHGEALPGDLFIAPQGNQVQTNLKPHLIRALSLINLRSKGAALEFVPFTNAIPPTDIKMHSQSFLWQLSLWTSRGRLQQQIPTQKALTLTQWPDFNLLSEFPHALKLAACLMRNGCIPEQVAERQQVPLHYVYSFLSAANSLGLLAPYQNTPIHSSNTAGRGLLQRMLRHLRTE